MVLPHSHTRVQPSMQILSTTMSITLSLPPIAIPNNILPHINMIFSNAHPHMIPPIVNMNEAASIIYVPILPFPSPSHSFFHIGLLLLPRTMHQLWQILCPSMCTLSHIIPGVTLTIISCHKLFIGFMPGLFGTYSMADDTIPVSYPNRNPPV